MNTMSLQAGEMRSPVYRLLQGAGCAESVAKQDNCGLIDLSLVPRCGVRGAGSQSWLDMHGLPKPLAPNRALSDDSCHWVLRLSQTEHWLLGNPMQAGQSLPEIAGEGCNPVYCEDSRCWFALTGRHRAEVMAKLCGVDLRPQAFELGAVAQTSLARVNAVIVHHQINGEQVFSIFSDSASAEYLWVALLDAMAEFGGVPFEADALG